MLNYSVIGLSVRGDQISHFYQFSYLPIWNRLLFRIFSLLYCAFIVSLRSSGGLPLCLSSDSSVRAEHLHLLQMFSALSFSPSVYRSIVTDKILTISLWFGAYASLIFRRKKANWRVIDLSREWLFDHVRVLLQGSSPRAKRSFLQRDKGWGNAEFSPLATPLHVPEGLSKQCCHISTQP